MIEGKTLNLGEKMAKFFFLDDHLINAEAVKSLEIVQSINVDDEFTFQIVAQLEHKKIYGPESESYDYVRRELEDICDYITEAQA